MDVSEQTDILEALRRSRQSFLNSLDGVSEDFAAKSPGTGRWSILECAEHVAAAEDYMFTMIMQSKDGEVSVLRESREAVILARGADRSRRFVSPEAVRPAGRFSTLASAVQHFLDTRHLTIQFVEGCRDDLHRKFATHPLLGPVNCHEVLALMAVHPERHAKQIEEVRAIPALSV